MPIRVVELFAGVGGFRLGLEGPPGQENNSGYKVVWSNQWEPNTKKQHATEVYVERWGLVQSEENPLVFHDEERTECHVNDDIAKVDAEEIPEHDLLTGGFPCQDYSVARTLSQATGLEGKKGVLWWEIHRILEAKRPPLLLLENVDRLLKSPKEQRGRDFAVMLASLSELGYVVEWRVINAADYGMPQRRRRVFILGYAPGTPAHDTLSKQDDILDWIQHDGMLAQAFPIQPLGVLLPVPSTIKGREDADLADVSDEFNAGAASTSKSPFKESGVMVGDNFYTYKIKPIHSGDVATLGDILESPGSVPLEYGIEPESVLKEKGWKYLKGAKAEPREGTDGFTYDYKEGPMVFPDALDKPSRTIVTGEGGSSPSRFKHVVKFRPTKKMREHFDSVGEEVQRVRDELGLKKTEWLRRLTPIELERLNMFPDDHTVEQSDGKRAFFMGNALVVGVIERLSGPMSNALLAQIEKLLNRISIPCEIFLSKWSVGKNSEKAERRKTVQDAGRNWGVSDELIRIQRQLKKAVETDPKSDETNELIEILRDMRDKAKEKKQGVDFTPPDGYPGGRRIIFIKPGKESFQLVARSGRMYVKNENDMLPMVISGEGEEVKLTTQEPDSIVSLGEMARELAKISRISKSVYEEVCAILVRMAYYFDADHEKLNESWAWRPNGSFIAGINQLHEQLSDESLDEPIDLWDFLLVCHSVSIQEEVKYRDNPNMRVGRHNTLTSLIVYSELLCSESDSDIEYWMKEFNSILRGSAAPGISSKKLKDRFDKLVIAINPETDRKYELEQKNVDELKLLFKENNLTGYSSLDKDEKIELLLSNQL